MKLSRPEVWVAPAGRRVYHLTPRCPKVRSKRLVPVALDDLDKRLVRPCYMCAAKL